MKLKPYSDSRDSEKIERDIKEVTAEVKELLKEKL